MFFFSLRRTLRAPVLLGGITVCELQSLLDYVSSRRGGSRGEGWRYLPAFFLPATVLRGPLRVRALVWVRCP